MTEYLVSDSVRNDVWVEWYDTERLSRYYSGLLKHHKRIALGVKIVTILASIAVTLTFFFESMFSDAVWVKVLMIVGFLTGYVFDSFYESRKLRTITQVRKACSSLESMWQELWRDIESKYQVDDEYVQSRHSDLLRLRGNLVDNVVIDAQLSENKALNVKSAQEARQTMINLYERASA